MNSPRWRAGTRRNKHLPVARQTRVSDRVDVNQLRPHYVSAFWGGIPGECGAECGCGVTYDGFDTMAHTGELLDRHVARCTRPNHGARAVDIAACFPGAGILTDERGPEAARRAGDCGRFAAPMTALARRDAYIRQTPAALTYRQARRIWHKARSVGEQL